MTPAMGYYHVHLSVMDVDQLSPSERAGEPECFYRGRKWR